MCPRKRFQSNVGDACICSSPVLVFTLVPPPPPPPLLLLLRCEKTNLHKVRGYYKAKLQYTGEQSTENVHHVWHVKHENAKGYYCCNSIAETTATETAQAQHNSEKKKTRGKGNKQMRFCVLKYHMLSRTHISIKNLSNKKIFTRINRR